MFSVPGDQPTPSSTRLLVGQVTPPRPEKPSTASRPEAQRKREAAELRDAQQACGLFPGCRLQADARDRTEVLTQTVKTDAACWGKVSRAYRALDSLDQRLGEIALCSPIRSQENGWTKVQGVAPAIARFDLSLARQLAVGGLAKPVLGRQIDCGHADGRSAVRQITFGMTAAAIMPWLVKMKAPGPGLHYVGEMFRGLCGGHVTPHRGKLQ